MPCCDIWLCSTMSHRRPDVRQLDCQTDIAIARAAPRARLKKIKHHTDVLRQRQSRCRNSNTHGMEVLLRIKEELIPAIDPTHSNCPISILPGLNFTQTFICYCNLKNLRSRRISWKTSFSSYRETLMATSGGLKRKPSTR